MDIDREAVLQTYLAESEEQFVQMEEALVLLETRPEDEETVEVIFRAMHTLKGNASSLGFPEVADFAHALENVLQQLRKRTLPVTDGLITRLLRAVDILRKMVPEVVAGFDDTASARAELLSQLTGTAANAGEEAASPTESEWEGRRRRPFARRQEDIRTWIDQMRTLRVDMDTLDRMLNLSGEIAIARGRFKQMLEEKRTTAELLEAHRIMDMLSMELQELIMKIRMVPVGPMFRQHIRTVRDVARSHGKTARLFIDGEDVEVDTTVIEYLRDPLTHMIRNAMDHGIERPEERKAAGKDPCGRITLRAFHDSGSIVIQVEDDGAGFNRARILEKALSRGLISESQKLSDQAIYRLAFEPGFSTAETVTDLSGRGVGMDVVLRNVDALRGSIGIESHEGRGATLTVRLPLTLAIIEGFAVGVEQETYVIPLDRVSECLELPAEERGRAGDSGVIHLRGKPVPYVRLRHLFALGGTAPQRENVVIVQHGSGEAGIAVDTLYGESQCVIKPLGRLFHGLSGVSGSTILGNGRVALILDIPNLLRSVTSHQSQPIGT